MKASAPGKIILFGEHAVVHGQPAIAVPVFQVEARATVRRDERAEPGGYLIAPQIGVAAPFVSLEAEFWARKLVRLVEEETGTLPPFSLELVSTIPVGSGLGSGAAVAVAGIRALFGWIGHDPGEEKISGIAFEIEKSHHVNPSGIDNTVVTYARPVAYRKGEPVERLQVGAGFTLVIGDTGLSSPTGKVVEDVGREAQKEPEKFGRIFDGIGALSGRARRAVETGETHLLGPLMDRNQQLLEKMGVSSPELNRLIRAAKTAGAAGAKLSGAGRGGNMIALVSGQTAEPVAAALVGSGAAQVLITNIPPDGSPDAR